MGNLTWIILGFIATFIIGAGVGASGVESSQPVKVETKEVCPQEVEWRELKDVDDQGFNLAGDGFETASKMLLACGIGDVNALEKHNEEFRNNTNQLLGVANKRQEVLKKLGY